jgi:hypothetical protein
MVDLTRDEHGCLQARLLDAVQGRSGKVYADWLTEHGVDAKVASSMPPWTGSVAMPTRSATSCPTPSTSSSSPVNGVIEKTRRLAHGFRNFTNYRIRILLAADGSRPTDADHRSRPNHADLGRGR